MTTWPGGAPRVGDRASLTRTVEAADIVRFTELSGDRNPLHSMYSLSQLWKQVVDDLPTLTQPVLLYRSRVDKVVPKVSVDTFHQRATNCKVTEVWLEDSYHVATLDNDAPQIFEGSVEFIEQLRH